jgi:Fe-S-cluster containining protein
MPSPRLAILNMVPQAAWEEQQRRPRFLQPRELSLDPCAVCVGNCCFAQVRVTTVEALRIALALTLPILDVVQVSPAPEGAEAQDHRQPIPLASGAVRLSLRVREGHRCLFLFHVNGRGRCGIHALRPGPCRIYPFHVQQGQRRVSVGGQSMCPVGWLQNEDTVKRVAADLKAWDADIAAEKRLLAAWARHPGADRSLPAYLTFAVGRLARRFGKDPAVLLAPPRRRLGDRR